MEVGLQTAITLPTTYLVALAESWYNDIYYPKALTLVEEPKSRFEKTNDLYWPIAVELLTSYFLEKGLTKILPSCNGFNLSEQVGAGIIYPISIVREKIGLERKGDLATTTTTIVKKDGWKGLFAGWVPTMIELLLSGVTEHYISKITNENIPIENGKLRKIIRTGLKCTSCIIWRPLAVVGQELRFQSGNEYKEYDGYVDCVKKIYQKKGMKGFYHGLKADMLIQACAEAVHIEV